MAAENAKTGYHAATASVPLWMYLFLCVGLVAASQSGNLVRLGSASPVAIAGWRLLLASMIMGVLAGPRLADLLSLCRKDVILLVCAGVALSLHLTAWIAAVQHTKVANAAMFFSINPIFTAIAAHYVYGEAITKRLALSVAIGLAGIFVIGYDDMHLSIASLNGDALAVLSSVLFTVYFLFGKTLRRSLDNRVYVAGIYFVAAVVSFAIMLALGVPVTGYSSRTWLCFLLLAIVPTAIGHTSLNAALRYFDASRVSAATLSEPVMAGAVAWLAWGEVLDWSDAAGFLLISISVLALVFERKKTAL
jgi:drug/metabolite transporter (DMT)-like permease